MSSVGKLVTIFMASVLGSLAGGLVFSMLWGWFVVPKFPGVPVVRQGALG